MGYDVSLSASKLNLFKECPRCFYDAQLLKQERPRGIFPGLPGGVDRVMKAHLDHYRELRITPPGLESLTGHLWGTVAEIKKLRQWQSGLKAEFEVNGRVVRLIGALDDLWEELDGTFSPLDVKTKGDIPRDDGAQYYQTQVDIYALLLESNGRTPSGRAYLWYWYPVTQLDLALGMERVLYTLSPDANRGRLLIAEAVALLESGQPDANPSCEYCRFAQSRVEAALNVVR